MMTAKEIFLIVILLINIGIILKVFYDLNTMNLPPDKRLLYKSITFFIPLLGFILTSRMKKEYT